MIQLSIAVCPKRLFCGRRAQHELRDSVLMDAASFADRGQSSRDDLVARLTDCPRVEVRLALDLTETPARARYITLTSGVWARQGPVRRWTYGSLELVETEISGEEAGRWIADGEGSVPSGDRTGQPIEFSISNLSETGSWERLPGYSGRDRSPLRFPFRRFNFSSTDGGFPLQNSQTWLVARDAPAFASADLAVDAFFHDVDSASPANRSDLLVVRIVESGPWISGVEFGGGEVVVAVDGIEGVVRPPDDPFNVEFFMGERRSPVALWSAPWTATFPVQGARLGEWWIVLSSGRRWYDYRQSGPYGTAAGGIIVEEATIEPENEIEALLAVGECSTVEFKSDLSPEAKSNAKMARTIAAFANGSGGTIVFGIDPDEATILGVSQPFDAIRDRLTDIVHGQLTTPPTTEVRSLDTDQGLMVVLLIVHPGNDTPYGVGKANPHYYVRANATTLPATADQVRRLARERPPISESHTGLPYPW